METIIKPSSKRYSVDICGETFTTQKSLIEKVKSVFGELETHQEFMKAFVSTYEKVILQNTHIKKVYYGPNDYMRSYFKHSNCLHVVFEDNTEITVSYKNIVSAWFDSEKAAIQKFKGDKLQEYRLAIYPEVLDFRNKFWHSERRGRARRDVHVLCRASAMGGAWFSAHLLSTKYPALRYLVLILR